MSEFTDRTGEKGVNNFGSEMMIVKYRGALDMDVYFPKYNWICNHVRYSHFKIGNIKCPYEPRVYGKGYFGEGKYKSRENGKMTKFYNTWKGMLGRCYDPIYQEKFPTYKECKVEDYLLNFQQAAEFFKSIYYEVPNERMHLDKDILVHGNKLYSRETCIFVPQRINELFTKNQSKRGKTPIGVIPDVNKFRAQCNDKNGNRIYLGIYDTQEEAFQIYKEYKEDIIKQVADEYKDLIPENVYDSLYNYEVNVDD